MRHYSSIPMLSSFVLLLACGSDGDGRSGHDGDSGILSVGDTGTDSAGESADEGNDDDGVRLDVGQGNDLGPIGCGGDASQGGQGGDAEIDFSYIWIANSTEGTISKIDTQTMQEMGRYIVREDSAGSPSRTSVNMSGDVAVANRLGGVTKVYAVPDNCPDVNGDGVITTSSGPHDVLPWGQDECVAWHTPFPTYSSQRPVAWAQGEWNPATCEYDNQKLWTSGGSQAGGIEVVLLDGATGDVEQTVHVPEVQFDGFGIYGAAVDGEGNFWGSQLGQSGKYLVFVDRETFQYRVWPQPVAAYGMTVDSEGYVWTCQTQVARFDPQTETWATAETGGAGGCMADGQGLLWQAGVSHLTAVDTQTLQVVQTVPVEYRVHGVSIDFYGYVWGVTLQQPFAYRVDPSTGVIDTFDGLTGPYTYSDMTGFALQNAGTIPTPQG
jgi:hypothetical protein